MAAEKEAFEDLYYPMSSISNIEKFDDFCKGWRAAIERVEALKPPHNSAMDAIAAFVEYLIECADKRGDNLWWFDTFVHDSFDEYNRQQHQ